MTPQNFVVEEKNIEKRIITLLTQRTTTISFLSAKLDDHSGNGGEFQTSVTLTKVG